MATMVIPQTDSFKRATSDLYGTDFAPTEPATPQTVTPPVDPDPIRQTYRRAVELVANKAKATLPDSHGRIDLAVKLVLSGDVQLTPDGLGARVGSQSAGGKTYTVNGLCSCPDAQKAPRGMCKHRIGFGIAKRAYILATYLLEHPEGLPEDVQDVTDAQVTQDEQASAPPEQASNLTAAEVALIAPHISLIHGRKFIAYSGLLLLAHARGLQRLEARFISVTDTLALAEAEAVFLDGRTFHQVGDSSPGNVSCADSPALCPPGGNQSKSARIKRRPRHRLVLC